MDEHMRKFYKDSSSSGAHVHQPREANIHSNSAMKFTQIPVIEWKCPHEFIINDEWQVASCEQSAETKTQMLRAEQVVEAVYSDLSSIPPNPLEPLGKEIVYEDDDSSVRVIPIEEVTAAEAADAATTSEAAEGESSSKFNFNIDLELLMASDSDLVVDAVSLALKAAKACDEMGDKIDKDLLIKLFENAHLIVELSNKISSDRTPVPNPVAETLPVISTEPEMVEKSLKEPRVQADNTGDELIRWPANQLNLYTAPNPTSLFPWPDDKDMSPVHGVSGKPDVEKIKRLINEHGREDSAGDELMQRPASQTNFCYNVSLPSPSPTYTPAADQPRNTNWAAGPSGGKRMRL